MDMYVCTDLCGNCRKLLTWFKILNDCLTTKHKYLGLGFSNLENSIAGNEDLFTEFASILSHKGDVGF